MRIATNVMSLNSQETIERLTKYMQESLMKLGTGLAINKASDNASGLAISDKLRTQQSSITQSIDNANSAVAMLQIGDKAMGEQSNILDIVKSKLLQASTSTTSDEGRKAIAKDVYKLLTQLDNIASQTNYNKIYLLQQGEKDQDSTYAMSFMIGDKEQTQIKTESGIQSNTKGLAIVGNDYNLEALLGDVSGDGTNLTAEYAKEYLKGIDDAISKLNSYRADFGSTVNQIEVSAKNLLSTRTNMAAAESVIRDVDYASESANFSKYSMIYTASLYASSQANAMQDNVMMVLTTAGK